MRFFVRIFVCTIALLFLLGCASVAPTKVEIACDAWPKYPEIAPKEVSRERLVVLVNENTIAEYMIASRSAADRLEHLLRRNAGERVDIEQVFYENQIDLLSGVCPEDEDGSSLVPAATLVSRVSAALIHAAGLRDAPDHVVEAVLPSVRQNLTAKANILFLAASCSSKSHPSLAERLERIGLACAD